jgi:hypothetical protein
MRTEQKPLEKALCVEIIEGLQQRSFIRYTECSGRCESMVLVYSDEFILSIVVLEILLDAKPSNPDHINKGKNVFKAKVEKEWKMTG